MRFLDMYRQAATEQDSLRSFERDLGLKKGSIRCEFERRLYLSGISIEQVTSTYDQLIDIASITPFEFMTVEAVYLHVNDVEKTRLILNAASQRAIHPYSILNAIQ